MNNLKINVHFSNFYQYKPLFVYINSSLSKEIYDNGTYEIQTEESNLSVFARSGFVKSNIISVNFEEEETLLLNISNNKTGIFKMLFILMLCVIVIVACNIIIPNAGAAVGVVIGYMLFNVMRMNIIVKIIE